MMFFDFHSKVTTSLKYAFKACRELEKPTVITWFPIHNRPHQFARNSIVYSSFKSQTYPQSGRIVLWIRVGTIFNSWIVGYHQKEFPTARGIDWWMLSRLNNQWAIEWTACIGVVVLFLLISWLWISNWPTRWVICVLWCVVQCGKFGFRLTIIIFNRWILNCASIEYVSCTLS